MGGNGDRRLRFGDYELDSRSEKLLRDGRPVKIQPQPLRVLAVLAEHRGEIVSREQLRERIWGAATFVEFDQGLNYCIRQIRVALCDEASKPAYVETLPKQGYRFIASVVAAPKVAEVDVAAEDKATAAPSETPPHQPLSSPVRPARKRFKWHIAAVAVAWAAALAFVDFRETPPVAQPVRLQIAVPDGMTVNNFQLAISPDGRRVVFSAGATGVTRRLWVRDLDSPELKPLPGTEQPESNVPPPFWSPDSRFVVFDDRVDGKLKKVEISGGPPQTVCGFRGPAGSGAWSKDGVIVFGSNNGALTRCPAAGGLASPMTVLTQGETAHRFPQFLPDNRHFLYARTSNAPEKTGVFVGSLDAKPAEQDLKPLLVTDRQAYYAPSMTGGTGWLLFVREATLVAQPFDPGKLALSGEPVPIATPIGSFPRTRYAFFTVSNTGVVVYRGEGGRRLQLTWVDAQGKTSTIGEPGDYEFPTVSPDGKRVAVSQINSQGNQDIWVLDTSRGTSTRLTFDPADDQFAAWSPDGARIVFRSDRGRPKGTHDLYVKASDGSGDDQLLLKTDEDKFPNSWSSDGRYLLYSAGSPKTGSDLWVLPLDGPRGAPGKPFPFLKTEFDEGGGQFSPGTAGAPRWIAYMSNESGTEEVYVRPFSPDASGGSSAPGGTRMVSRGGGAFPHWRSDGKQLFYKGPAGTIMAVDVTSDKPFQAGVPRRLFETVPGVSQSERYGMTPDGKRFLFLLPSTAGGGRVPITVMMNWQAGLKK